VAKIVLFDDNAKAKSMPILKISENDISASHATSVGTLNENEVFYLTSRGISEDMAKNLITLGYFNPIISKFDEEAQEEIQKLIKIARKCSTEDINLLIHLFTRLQNK
jgi:Fe-S cluster assembly protein SufD